MGVESYLIMRRWTRVLAGITGVMVASCQGESSQGAGGRPPSAVDIQPVAMERLLDSDIYIARLDNRQLATVQPQVSGEVTEIFVQLGDQVSAGAPLVQIQSLRQEAVTQSGAANVAASQAAVATAEANLQAARASLRSREADLALAQTEDERTRKLFDEGVLAQESVDRSERAVVQAEANLQSQREQIQALEAAVRQADQTLAATQASATAAEIDLGFFRVTAPVSGIVGEVNVRTGDFITPQTIITTVSQDSNLELVLQIPLNRAPDISIGTPVEILDSAGEPLARTQISFIAPDADAATQSVLVRAVASNAASLRTDQFVRVRVIWEEYDTIVIPLTAITRLAGQSFVYVATETDTGLVADQRPVELGRLQGNAYEVLDGLDAGEPIVISGLQKLFPMAPITPTSAEEAAEPTATAP